MENMEVKASDVEKRAVSVLQDDGFCMNKILARESSAGQSSRVFYREAEGVPFRWEMQPGTPKNPQEQDAIPPLSPSPLMQSLGLPLPNLDHDESQESAFKTSKIWKLKKRIHRDIVKKMEMLGRRSKQQEMYMNSVKNSSFSSTSSASLFSQNSHVLDSSMVDGPFCCSPWNVPAILEEGNTSIYYCSQHKTAFAVEEDGSFLSRILSAGDQFSGALDTGIPPAGVPFRWEMQPGTPKAPPENALIPPPSPPPAVQSLSLPRRGGGEAVKKSTWKTAWFWTRGNDKKKGSVRRQYEMSFRCNERSCDEEFDASSYRESDSVSSLSSITPLSKGDWRMSKIRRNLSRIHFLVFVRRKFKSFTS